MPKTTFKTRPAPRQAARPGAGRKPLPHPFREMGAAIVGKTINGQPKAAVHRFVASDAGELAKLKNRFRRQLTRTGKELRPESPIVFPMRVEWVGRVTAGHWWPARFELIFWDRDAGR